MKDDLDRIQDARELAAQVIHSAQSAAMCTVVDELAAGMAYAEETRDVHTVEGCLYLGSLKVAVSQFCPLLNGTQLDRIAKRMERLHLESA